MVNWDKQTQFIELAWRHAMATSVHTLPAMRENSYFSVVMPQNMHALVAKMATFLLSREVTFVEARYPANWVQAVKARWAPAWVLKRWPVREIVKRLSIHDTYPHCGLNLEQYGKPFRVVQKDDLTPRFDEVDD